MLVHYGRSGEEIKNKYGVERLTTCVSQSLPGNAVCRPAQATFLVPPARDSLLLSSGRLWVWYIKKGLGE